MDHLAGDNLIKLSIFGPQIRTKSTNRQSHLPISQISVFSPSPSNRLITPSSPWEPLTGDNLE